MGELSLNPKFVKRKGQSNAEAFFEYEKDNVALLHVYLNDLR